MSRNSILNKTTEKIRPANEEISCSWPECHRIFFSLENLEKHLKIHSGSLHECIYCNRQFQGKSVLKRHVRIHTGEKPYTCDFCLKSFSRLDRFQDHMRMHTGEKPYNCKICAKSFASSNSLIVHQRIHTGDKPFKCDICGKSFSQSNHLVAHQRIHNRDKPFKCATCSKSFFQLGNLKSHMKIHTGERPFNCELCSNSFSWKKSLRSHMRTHTDKLPPAHSNGRKRKFSNRNQHIRIVEKNEEQNKPNNCKLRAKHIHREDEGSSNGVTMRVKTTRMQTEYKEKNKQLSSLTCQVCHQVSPSLQNLCRHYSLQHNLPKVIMLNLVLQS